MYFWPLSFENAMSHTEPSPSVFGAMIFSFTNDPSFLNSWILSLARSQTYTRPSVVGSAQCTGFRNCCATGASGLYGPRFESDGTWPYAPQYRLIFPLSMSSTATRWLP